MAATAALEDDPWRLDVWLGQPVPDGGLPIVATVEEAAALGSEVFVLGIAPAGGLIPESWYPVIDKAVEGRLEKIFAEKCLMAKQYVPDESKTVEQMRTELVGKIGENIQVRRFVRLELGG